MNAARFVAVAFVLLAAPPLRLADQQPRDASTLIASARQALGGDAALAAITSFSVTGTMTHMRGPNASSSVDIKCVLPDRFLRVAHQTMDHPVGSFSVTRYEGFNRDQPINDVVAPQAPMPVVIPAGPEPKTPDEVAAARLRQATTAKRIFVALSLPILVASFEAYPLTFEAGDPSTLPSGPADVVVARAADGFTWRLYLDAKTHLPVRLSWMARPIVTRSTTSMASVNERTGAVASGRPPGFPAGDPTSGMPDVPWEMTISDYRAADGLTWPHRMTTTVGADKYEELRLGRFRLNPGIDAKVFAPRK